MEQIEQAVFLCAGAERSGDAGRAVASPGVRDSDLREILAWGPSDETLLAADAGRAAVHFHPLPSGAYALGCTTVVERAGPRNGRKAATQCLIVRPRLLARFASHPLALLRAAEAAGLLHVYEELPARVDSMRLEGRAGIVDAALLGRLRLDPGPEWMATLVQAALDSMSTAIVGGTNAEEVVAGVLDCLPPECRIEMPFSIGLRFSARRPYRLAALSGDAEEQGRMERLYDVAVFDLTGRPPAQCTPVGSWGSLIHRVLRSGRIAFFAGQLARRPLDFSSCDLPALGLQMLEELDASAFAEDADDPECVPEDELFESRWAARASAEDFDHLERPGAAERGEERPAPERGRRRAHAPHPRRSSRASYAAGTLLRPSPPSKEMNPDDPEIMRKLERLDDLVFAAISGDPTSLENLKTFWPEVHAALGDGLVAESREQYLRYALETWERLSQREGLRDPTLAMQSLEVLSVLFSGACGW